MDKIVHDTQNSLNISEDVVATIAKEAVKDVSGVASLDDPSGKSVKISLGNGVCQITLGIIAKESCRLKDTCEQLQNVIKDTVQNMTGITVSKVNVQVASMAAGE